MNSKKHWFAAAYIGCSVATFYSVDTKLRKALLMAKEATLVKRDALNRGCACVKNCVC